jgi:translation initiation factor 4G
MAMSRGGSRRGGDRAAGGEQTQGADGWSVAGGQPRPPPKAGDLSNFGKINKAAPMTFGPSSVFAGKKETKRDSTLSRTSSNSNMFSMLSGGEDPAAAASAAKSSRPSSRRTSVDFGQSGVPEPPAQRRKLQLLPRTKPVEETKANGASEEQSEDDSDAEGNAIMMSQEEAEKKVVEDIKEFFGIRNIDESEDYFSKLHSEHWHLLVEKMVMKAIESKEADAQLVADTFQRAVEKSLCSPDSFEQGFIPTAEILDDIAIDAPKAFDLMAIMMRGAGLDKDEERYSRIADKLADRDQLISRFA